jgi:Holliday junction resolvase-like predicted endonuclease
MEYNRFKVIFNEIIFEKSKADLIEKIAENPSRYIGLFRPTKPKAKILQNLLQSHEIRFGDAFEKVIEEYLQIKGCEILPRRFVTSDNDTLNIDQCFRYKGKVYFVEQKVRDDHDSTKKRGQIENFEKKLDIMLTQFDEKELVGIFYFIDPDLVKNKNFYISKLQKMSQDYNVETQIFYGKSFFDYLGMEDVWQEILIYLEAWKQKIPDLPEINFDLDSVHTFEEIKDLRPLTFRKLFSNDQIFEQIVLTLFPEKTTLKLLLAYFESKEITIYKNLASILQKRLSI